MNIARQFIAGYRDKIIVRPAGTVEDLRMAHTLSSINIHYVFSTKNREALIVESVRDRLWAFMGGIARKNKMIARSIGGVSDHVHLLVTLPPMLAVAKAVQLIKGGSSAWVRRTIPGTHRFAWQEGYGAFSVSQSHIDATIAYIQKQEHHHKRLSFQDEYLAFLKKHDITYDPKYLWD